jgi:O6-methylguanine-DNA--protein-cysteine methyltransferase
MFSCNQGVRVGRPKTYDQVAQLVKMYPHVMATGMGHSWNKVRSFVPEHDDRCSHRDRRETLSVLARDSGWLKGY